MLTLIRRARRRLYQNELLFQGANAGSAALVAFILLILLGTEVLSWQVAVLLPLGAAGVGLYLARKRTPSAYKTAQIVDRRMSLADTLSTAFYFAEHADAPASAEMRRIQSETAEKMAASIDPANATPFTMPRSVYAMAVLLLIAGSLFGLRYGLTRSLDLQPPLARILQQAFGYEERTETAQNRRRQPKQDPLQADPNQDGNFHQDGTSPQPKEPESSQDNEAEASAGAFKEKGANDSQQDGDQAEPAAEGDKTGEGDNQEGNKQDQKGESADAKSEAAKEGGKPGSPSDSNSIFDKMKDFAQNLLSKMKSPSEQKPGEQQSKQGKGQQSGKQQGSKDGKQQGEKGDPQEGQSGEEASNSGDMEKGSGSNDSQQASKQPGSGVGSQDGDKSIKQAEQLAAMGKISEIIGKRSASVSGEATVEVKNTNQQIRTPYAQRGAQHSQGGAEINRDEVPVALQSYVEQYFEQVRKQAPKK